MLTEQIIDFQLKRPGPPGRTCSPIQARSQKFTMGRLFGEAPSVRKFCIFLQK